MLRLWSVCQFRGVSQPFHFLYGGGWVLQSHLHETAVGKVMKSALKLAKISPERLIRLNIRMPFPFMMLLAFLLLYGLRHRRWQTSTDDGSSIYIMSVKA